MSRARTSTPAVPVAASPATPGASPGVVGDLTEEDRREARVWMQAARARALQLFPYLDTALSSMVLVERIGLGTVAVDARWRLYYDPARALHHATTLGVEHLVADWIHELMHVLRNHPARWLGLSAPPENHVVFNVAGDAHVNADVEELGLPLLPSDVTFASLPPDAGCERAMTTEEIYTRLLEEREGRSPAGRRRRRRGGTQPGSPPVGGEAPQPGAADGPFGGRGSGAVGEGGRDCGSGTGGAVRPWEEPADRTDDGSVDSTTAGFVTQATAAGIREAARGIGKVPGQLAIWAESVLEPAIDWRRELRSVVSRRIGTQAGLRDYSFTRVARRRVPGFTLPGMVGAAPPGIAAVIDTSGSMQPEDLALCLSDLLGLARSATRDSPAIDVLVCDAQVHSHQRVRRPSDAARVRLTGGGGTNMTEGIEAAAQLPNAPDVVVVMTDGWTPWPAVPPRRLQSSLVIALLTQRDMVASVPAWIRTIVVPTRAERSA